MGLLFGFFGHGSNFIRAAWSFNKSDVCTETMTTSIANTLWDETGPWNLQSGIAMGYRSNK